MLGDALRLFADLDVVKVFAPGTQHHRQRVAGAAYLHAGLVAKINVLEFRKHSVRTLVEGFSTEIVLHGVGVLSKPASGKFLYMLIPVVDFFLESAVGWIARDEIENAAVRFNGQAAGPAA